MTSRWQWLIDLFEDAFMLIARDGAGSIEIQLRIRKALGALSKPGDERFRQAAVDQAGLALAGARREPELPEELSRLESIRL